MRHVVFRLAAERFALPLEAVREVVLPQPPFARVPRASDAVRGVMNLRGRVVAVVDLAAARGPRAAAARGGGRAGARPRSRQARARAPHRRRARRGAARAAAGARRDGLVRGVAAARAGRGHRARRGRRSSREAARLFGGR